MNSNKLNKRNNDTHDKNGNMIVNRKPKETGMVNLSAWLIAPPKTVIRLRYTTEGVLANGGGPEAYKYFNINGLFDLDPALGSTPVAGFVEWMGIYNVFHVDQAACSLTFSNNEQFNTARIATGFFPQVRTTFPSTQWGNAHCKEQTMLSFRGGLDRTTVKHSMDLKKLVANQAYVGDLPNYYGTTTANPNSILSFDIAARSSGPTLSQGVYFKLDIDLIVTLLYNRVLTQ